MCRCGSAKEPEAGAATGSEEPPLAASISRALAYLRALKLAAHAGNKKDTCLHVKNKVFFCGLKIKVRILSYCSVSLESHLTEFLNWLKTLCSENLLSF